MNCKICCVLSQRECSKLLTFFFPDVDSCESSPCQNGATCVDELDGYVCQCTDQWLGANCTGKLCLMFTVCFEQFHLYLFIDGLKWKGLLNYARNFFVVISSQNHDQNWSLGSNFFNLDLWGVLFCLRLLFYLLFVYVVHVQKFPYMFFNFWFCCFLTEFNNCYPNPCVHGTCTDVDDGYTCSCEDKYMGTECEVKLWHFSMSV